MAQRLVTSFVNTSIPDAYFETNVTSKPVGLGSSGIIAIVGEADGGDSYSNVVLKDNFFSPDQLAQVTNKYKSGPIVDAFRALSSPSADADITGSANAIYIVKTNTGTRASAIVDSTLPYGTLKDLNIGKAGNNYKYQITQLQAEVAPTVTGSNIPLLSGTYGATFTVRYNGGAATVATVGAGPYTTGAQVAASITGLPSGITASGAGTGATSTITLTVAADVNANHNGWGKSFELIDSTPGNLASLGLTAGLKTSASEPQVEVSINNAVSGLSEIIDVKPIIAFDIGYVGTTATLTINKSTDSITTTVVGGLGTSLTLTLSQFRTISDLANYIGTQTGYTASVTAAAQQLSPSNLDDVSTIGIASTTASLSPGRIKNALQSFKNAIATSGGVSFTATATAGLPLSMASAAFLTGGLRGATLAADVVNAVNQLTGIQCNIVVPLFSQDATDDITAGLTDSASTYTIAAVNTLIKNHCVSTQAAKIKRNRIAVLSFKGTYANAKESAQGLAHYRVSLAFQDVTQVNSAGVITTFQPWYGAVVAAGMQAGGFYKSITNKLANVISFIDPSGFDNGSPGSVEDALNAGMLILTHTQAGNSWVSDQTTYGFDTNFVYNSIQAVYTSDILSLDLAASFKSAFVGKSLADVSAATALSFLAQKMDGYKKLKLIAASDDAPLGWKNPKVSITAPEMDVSVEIKLATAIYFIPISINISQVQQNA